MKNLLLILGLSLLIFPSCKNSTPSQTTIQKPNILWIAAENFKLDFGCYGAENVYTPNIDSLAANGIRYNNVFSTSPVCAPSRSAFMVGMYQTTTGTHHMRSHRDDDYRLPEGVRPITHRLQDADYFTANITHIGDKEVGTGKLDLNFVNEGPIYHSDDWSSLKDNQPFFAQINTPEAEYDIYDRESYKKERVTWVGEEWHPQIATPENVTPPPYYPDHEITREEWARYLNSASGLDVRVGWILEQLEKDGLADNTIIVFFADNGSMEARGIHWPWDMGIHVPMIIYYPKGITPPSNYQAGSTNDDVISLLDLTATTLQMAGISKPEGMQSRVFLGDQLDEPRELAFSARDRIDETVNRMRSVRGSRYHYIRSYMPSQGLASLNRYKEKCFLVMPLMRKMREEGTLHEVGMEIMDPLPYELLYDTQNDPHEIYNLANSEDPEHQKILVQYRNELDKWMIETGDRGEIPEPDSIVAPFEKEMHDWFGTPDWYLEEMKGHH